VCGHAAPMEEDVTQYGSQYALPKPERFIYLKTAV
jgi:hypothetical protein